MVIYVDLIILLNFIIDFQLLMSVNLLLKRNIKIKKIIITSIIGALSTILLFYIKDNYLLFIYKIIISIIMVIICFKYETFNYFKDNLFYLYIISIILGGSIYLINDGIHLSNKGLIFTKNNNQISILLLMIWGFIIIYKYLKKEKNYQNTYSNYYDVSIYYDDIKLSGTGFLDTGNRLVDPYFHYPIILVNEELIHKKNKIFFVPYDTANNHGLLKVFKPKKIIIGKKTTKKVLIGLTNINMDGVKIILCQEAI